MIYVDTSLILAELLAEDRHPPDAIWNETLVSSRLLEYEVSVRLHTGKLVKTHGDAARALVGRVALLEMVAPVLAPALEPFRRPIRTLDAPSRQHRVPARPPAEHPARDVRRAPGSCGDGNGIALYDLDSGRR